MIDLSIVIVNWNVRDLLAACLQTITTSLDTPSPEPSLKVEILVVDSGSTDGSPEMLRDKFPQVRLLAQTENIGFTRGNNLALAQAQGRHLMLLNPDTEIMGDALKRMVAYLDTHPKVGIVGPHTLNTDGTTQSSRRHFPTLLTGIFESTWLQPFAPKGLLDHFYVNDQTTIHQNIDVDWVQGSALMARREVYEQIGGLDEGYIMYSEELDWCKRAKQAGWGVVYVGEADIIHHGGKSTEQVVARTQLLFQQSKLRYFRIYHGPLSAQVLRLVLLANYGVQLLIETAKNLLGHKRELRRQRMSAYWQLLRTGLKIS